MACTASALSPSDLFTYTYAPTDTRQFTGGFTSNIGCGSSSQVGAFRNIVLTSAATGQSYTCGTYQFYSTGGASHPVSFTCPVTVGSMAAGGWTLNAISTTANLAGVFPQRTVTFSVQPNSQQASSGYTQKRSRPDSDLWLQQASTHEVIRAIEAKADAEKRKATQRGHRKREVQIKGRMGGWSTLDKLD